MPDLTDWLAEVHAVDEQAARAGMRGQVQPWSVFKGDDLYINSGSVPIATVHGSGTDPDAAVHIARHDPQSVLARIDSERRVISRLSCVHDEQRGNAYSDTEDLADDVLRALAWGYRHREGWQESWAPESVGVDAR